MASNTVFSINSAVTTTAQIKERPIPEGYVLLYPGVRKPDNSYTTPILSVHLCHRSASATQTNSTQAIIYDNPNYRSPAYNLGMIQSVQENNFSFDEQVLIIPVEDILSICYRTGMKKEVKIQTTSVPIPRPPENCCTNLFSCFCCDQAEEPRPQRQEETLENKAVKRAITVTIEYSRYGRIDTPSHVRALNDSDRASFYNSRMNVDTLEFYLLISGEFDPIQFDSQRKQAEILSCLITRIKQMAPKEYPSETHLQELVQMQVVEIFGVVLQEPAYTGGSPTTQIPRTTQPAAINHDGAQ